MKQLAAKSFNSAFKVHNYLLCCAIRNVLICIHPKAHEGNWIKKKKNRKKKSRENRVNLKSNSLHFRDWRKQNFNWPLLKLNQYTWVRTSAIWKWSEQVLSTRDEGGEVNIRTLGPRRKPPKQMEWRERERNTRWINMSVFCQSEFAGKLMGDVWPVNKYTVTLSKEETAQNLDVCGNVCVKGLSERWGLIVSCYGRDFKLWHLGSGSVDSVCGLRCCCRGAVRCAGVGRCSDTSSRDCRSIPSVKQDIEW